MYTGIIQGTEMILASLPMNGFTKIKVSNHHHLFDDAFIGASVSINGVCLTVTEVCDDSASFDISDKTRETTTLQFIQQSDQVNIERSCKYQEENGGHSLYGHIEGMATVSDVQKHGETLSLTIKVPEKNICYFYPKGFIGLHGASLTVNDVDNIHSLISLNLIPETLRLTNFVGLKEGDRLNYEIDHNTRVIVDVITGILKNNRSACGNSL